MTLDQGGLTLVVKGVPASIYANCGEEYVDGEIAARLLQASEEVQRAGVLVGIREYVG